jgi:hypothetical protein
MQMEEVVLSETSIPIYQTVRRHIIYDSNLP